MISQASTGRSAPFTDSAPRSSARTRSLTRAYVRNPHRIDPGFRGGLEPGGDVDGEADRHVGAHHLAAEHPDGAVRGVQADAEVEICRDPARSDGGGQLVASTLHLHRRLDGGPRLVRFLHRPRRPEDGHDRVPDQVVHGSAARDHGRRHLPEEPVQDLRELLRLQALGEIGEADHVREQHRDPSTFERLVGPQVPAQQSLRHLGGEEPGQLSRADELGHLLVDPRLETPARLLQFRDVVVDDVEADRSALEEHTDGHDLHVDQRSVLPGPPTDPTERVAFPRLPAPGGRLRVDLGILRDQVVQVRADRLGRAVAEQLLRSGVPEADGHVLVDHDDGGRTHLDEGLEEAALAHQLADVFEHRERPHEPAVDHDRNGSEHDVDERTVLPRAARHELDRFGEHPLADRLGLRTDGSVVAHQLVDMSSDRLGRRVAEQALGGGIPGHDDQLRVAGDDRRGARLDQRLVVLARVVPSERLR